MLDVRPSKKTIKNNVQRRPIVLTALCVSFCKCTLNLRKSKPAIKTANVILIGSSSAVKTKCPLHILETETAIIPHRNKNASKFSSTLCTVSGKKRTIAINSDSNVVCHTANSITAPCKGKIKLLYKKSGIFGECLRTGKKYDKINLKVPFV